MSGELDAFASEELEQGRPERVNDGLAVLDVLMFEHDGEAYAIPASSVEGVVPWRNPAPVPGASSHVRGVIQDRGRIVAVLRHPTGRDVATKDEPRRIILCATSEGLVGLPASVTRAVTSAEYVGDPKPLAVYAGKDGAYTFVAPDRFPSAGESSANRPASTIHDAPSGER